MAHRAPSSAVGLKAPTRRALLVDLDNVTILDGRAVDTKTSARVVRWLLTEAGPYTYAVAAAPGNTLRRLVPTLAAEGLHWRSVPDGPDEADKALGSVAVSLLAAGYREIHIASCDHHFAPLGAFCDLTVLNPLAKPVAHELRAAAGRVRIAHLAHPAPTSTLAHSSAA